MSTGTGPTDVDPEEYVASLPDEKRRAGGSRLLALFAEATGERPTMWGPSMIGYGRHHYRYESGREGDTFRVGFAPRAGQFVLYGLLGVPEAEQALERLGPHTRGKGCVYVKRLDAIDEDALADAVRAGYAASAEA